jgi:hypothetical protein
MKHSTTESTELTETEILCVTSALPAVVSQNLFFSWTYQNRPLMVASDSS